MNYEFKSFRECRTQKNASFLFQIMIDYFPFLDTIFLCLSNELVLDRVKEKEGH
jgi:hypothetical protein